MSSSQQSNIQHKRQKRNSGVEISTNEEVNTPLSQSKLTSSPTSARTPDTSKKEPCCSSCSLSQERVKVFLNLGRGVLLCDGCIALCITILDEEGITTDDEGAKPNERFLYSDYSNRKHYHCSFCQKEQEEVARLIAMPNNLYICNRCVGRCNAALRGVQQMPEENQEPQSRQFQFRFTPSEPEKPLNEQFSVMFTTIDGRRMTLYDIEQMLFDAALRQLLQSIQPGDLITTSITVSSQKSELEKEP